MDDSDFEKYEEYFESKVKRRILKSTLSLITIKNLFHESNNISCEKAMCYLTLAFSLCAITGHASAVDKVGTVNQQKIVATGTVLDETGEPMPGVSIVEKMEIVMAL